MNGAAAAFIRATDRLSAISGAAAVAGLAAIAGLMLAEVFSRNFLGKSLHVTWELSAYAMGAVFFLAAPAALLRGEYVRVGILFELLSPRAARALDALATLAGLAVAAYIAAALFGLTSRSFAGDVRSWSGYRFPLAVPQAIFTTGATLFALQLLSRLARILTAQQPDLLPNTEPDDVDLHT